MRPAANDRDPVAELLDLDQQVAREQDRDPSPARSRISVAHVAHPRRVEAGRRLVEQQQARARAAAPRRSRGAGACRASSRRPCPWRGRASSTISSASSIRAAAPSPSSAASSSRFVAAAQVGVEARAPRRSRRRPPAPRRCTCGSRPNSRTAARGRADQAQHHPQRRRLAGAVRAEVAEDVAGLDGQVDVVDGDELAVALARPRTSIGGAPPAAGPSGTG